MSSLKENLFRDAAYNLKSYQSWMINGGETNLLTKMYRDKFDALIGVIDESGLTAEWVQYKAEHENKEGDNG